MTTTDLTTTADAGAIRVNQQGVAQFTEQGATLVREMLCPGARDVELAFFAGYCRRLGLDPFSGHVHLVKRKQKRGDEWLEVAKPELSVSGLLLLAERTGKYQGRTEYQWCGADGEWRDVWLDDAPPAAARVGVHRAGAPEPIYGVATWKSYAATTRAGQLTSMWKQHGPRMLGKCALALALREALPAELGGVYSVEEMQHASRGAEPEDQVVDSAPEEAQVLADEDAVTAVAERAKQLPDSKREELRAWMTEQAIPGQGMTADQLALLEDAVTTAEAEAIIEVAS